MRPHFSIAAAGIVLAGFIFAWSGLYNVAASRGHFAVVELALSFVMRNSVETHALTVPAPPPLDDPDLANSRRRTFSPRLRALSRRARPAAQCRHARHAAAAAGPAPTSASDGRTASCSGSSSTASNIPACRHGPRRIATTKCGRWSHSSRRCRRSTRADTQNWHSAPGRSDRCRRYDRSPAAPICHGEADRAPRSRLVPVLHGQPAAFLQAALSAYANGTRHSGIMQPIATDLSDRAIECARRTLFAPRRRRIVRPRLPRRARASSADARLAIEASPRTASRPARRAMAAKRSRRFHVSPGRTPPTWRAACGICGTASMANSDAAAIMAPIARTMSDQEIEDVSAYYSAQAPARRRP